MIQIFQQAVKTTSAKKGCANFSLSIEHNLAHVIPSFPINLEKVLNPLTEITIEEEVISIFPGVSGTKHTINSIIYMPMPSFHHILGVEPIRY